MYPPYSFHGDIPSEERERIIAILLKHHPALVRAMFNEWHFAKYNSGWWRFGRKTWNIGGVVCEACMFLERYFK